MDSMSPDLADSQMLSQSLLLFLLTGSFPHLWLIFITQIGYQARLFRLSRRTQGLLPTLWLRSGRSTESVLEVLAG